MHTHGSIRSTGTRKPRAVALQATSQPLAEPMENLGLLSWLLRGPRARRCTRQLERMHHEHNQRLTWHLQDIFVGRGLTQRSYSIAGGRDWRIPQVVSVVDGPPVGLNIHTLPGQMPDDFAKHAPAIAYNLGMAQVRVVPLGPSLIRLELLPKLG